MTHLPMVGVARVDELDLLQQRYGVNVAKRDASDASDIDLLLLWHFYRSFYTVHPHMSGDEPLL